MVSILISSSHCPHINVEYSVLAPGELPPIRQEQARGQKIKTTLINGYIVCAQHLGYALWYQLEARHSFSMLRSKMIFDVPFQTKLSSLYPFWFVYLFLSRIVGTFFLKRKVEIRYPCKHVLWRVDICNILLRGGIFPNILLLINPKYYQLLSEGHLFQIFLCLQRIGAVTLAGRIIGQPTCLPPPHSGVC